MTAERHRFEIARIGRGALAALAPGRQGSVLAIFRRSFYIECDDGVLACIGPAGMGDGPLNGLVRLPEGIDWQASGLAVGAPAHVDGRALKIGTRFEFGLESAAEWLPTQPADGWSRDSLTSGLAELRRAAGRFDLSQGLARLVLTNGPFDDVLVERGRAGAEALRKWIVGSEDRAEALSPDVSNLIGLGPGLTPSGDDLIGGAMIALYALGRAETAMTLAAWALPIARARTGKISVAHLAAAAEGEGAGALHDAIAAVAADDADAIAAAIAALDAIGHSSGWDALAGAVAVMSTLSA